MRTAVERLAELLRQAAGETVSQGGAYLLPVVGSYYR